MQIIDQITAKLETMTRDAQTLPAQIDALLACRDVGVAVPACGKFRNLDALDMALNAAFSPDGKPLDTIKWPQRVNLKTAILAAPQRLRGRELRSLVSAFAMPGRVTTTAAAALHARWCRAAPFRIWNSHLVCRICKI